MEWFKAAQEDGPWDGGKVIGVPEQDPGYSELINLEPENSQGGGYLTKIITIHLLGSSDFRWLYLQPDRMFQMIYLDDDSKMGWEEPNDPCDIMAFVVLLQYEKATSLL
nr:G-type lectin S-receptor-like serine/threonine-protein kinase At1g61550 [Tanacetum cinerariifolium]